MGRHDLTADIEWKMGLSRPAGGPIVATSGGERTEPPQLSVSEARGAQIVLLSRADAPHLRRPAPAHT
jgi:hypothetical protein